MSERQNELAREGLPAATIGMPVFNGAKFLEQSLTSVLGQTRADFELVISDNASTDETGDICRRYAESDHRIRYVRNDSNLGAARNFNRCVELARGKFFKWMAHDDLLAPTYLERCMAILEEGPSSLVLCFPQRIIITNDGWVLGLDTRRVWYEADPLYGRVGFAKSLFIPDRRIPELVFGLVRTKALRKTRLIGAYGMADLVLVTELRLLGEFRRVNEPLFFNRGHDETPQFKKARRTPHGEASWYDPSATTRKVFPLTRLLAERLRAVTRSDLTRVRKLERQCQVILAHIVLRSMTEITRRSQKSFAWCFATWERLSVSSIARAGDNCLPHRVWALLFSLRHMDPTLAALAVSPPTREVRLRLLAFVAQRLCFRRDERAGALLETWTNSGCELRRIAAADLLAERRAALRTPSRQHVRDILEAPNPRPAL